MATAPRVFSIGLAIALALGPAFTVLGADEAKPVGQAILSTATPSSPGGNVVLEMTGAATVPASTSVVPAVSGKHGKMPAELETPGQRSPKPEDAKTKESIKSIHRPSAAATSPNPDEFNVRPNSSGKIRLRFNGQPWQPVLEWLAKISGMSVDWQELPGDSLNLTTQRDYTVPEVRDLINRLLLDRGFTLLCHGEVLSVAEIKNIDPSLVPRVEPADLPNCHPHEFVKVSFPLVSLLAETVAEDLKPMLSPNGRLTPLNEINRLEAMDAVMNLRDIDAVLKQQADESQPRSFREFKLKHVRADEVHRLLTTLLDIESPKLPMAGMPPGNMNPVVEQPMMVVRKRPGRQQVMQVPGGNLPKPPTAVSMAVNEHNNSVLVQAPPDKMTFIAQVINAVDIPIDRNGSLLVNLNRMQVYHLSGIDPEPLVKTLMEIGNLDPATKLEVDKKNSAIIAYASLPDHVTIRAVVDKLTGSERKFEVIHLRRLAADYVAGTIDSMMGSGAKKEKTRSSRWFSPYDSSGRDGAETSKEFRVDADVEHNRLLLWANPVECALIETLLVKLGEISAAGSGPAVRVIDGGDVKETQELIARIRRAWPSVAPNTLLAPAVAPPPKAGKEPSTAEPIVPDNPSTKRTVPKPTPDTATSQAPAALFHLADIRREPSEKGDERPSDAPRAAPPPVKILIGPDGKLILSSEDAQALDRLEELATQLAVPRKDYRVFHLKYALAVGVAQNLDDFFKEGKRDRSRMPWWMMDDYQNDSQDERRLSKRRELTFISDADSNTILVEGASAEQFKTIEDLIKLYDQPPPSDAQSVRKTKLIHLKYSKAKAVADTVKDVYRDLLSSNDKALAGNNQGRDIRPNFIFGDSDTTEQKTPRFKGLLSIGVDEVSNSLMVSAPAYLFDDVAKMVEELDQAAAPDYTVQMVRVSHGMSATRMKELLNQVYMQKSSEKRPENERNGARPTRPSRPGRNGRPGVGSSAETGSGDTLETR